MNNKGREDKRIRRSKKIITLTFIDLMKKKDIRNITVTDIAKAADINRGTFYSHYTDVFDLINKLEDEHIDLCAESIRSTLEKGNNDSYVIINSLISYIEDNYDIYKTLFQSSISTEFEKKLQCLIINTGFMIQNKRKDTPYNRFVLSFIANGITGAMKKWITEENSGIGKEDVINMLNDIIHRTVSALR
ncbi:MAG: TetR/AcrR family transcriptional regulator [Eubacteriaceae bacterium]